MPISRAFVFCKMRCNTIGGINVVDFMIGGTMRNLQKRVAEFCRKHKMQAPLEYRVLDLVSEVGEVAKEVLKASKYGSCPVKVNSCEINMEIGDALYSLISVRKCNMPMR